MKKNAKTLLILSVILIVCVGAYIGVSQYNANVAKKETAETGATHLYSPSWDTPAKLSYEAGGSALSFTREDTQWYYDDDRDFPLNQYSVSSLATTLSSLTAIREFDAPDDLSQYGLDAPLYTVTASDSGGNILTLLIGGMSGENCYAMKSGGDKVYTIDSALVGYLEPDILNMITLDTIPTLGESTIDRITLTSDALTFTLDKYQERDGSYTWFIVEGSVYTSTVDYVLADGSKSSAVYVANVLSSLNGVSFTSCAAFKPDGDALESFGLAVPGLTVTVEYTTTDSNNNETSGTAALEIGQTLPDESGYYARLTGSDEANVLSTDDVDTLIQALNAMGMAV